MIPADEVPDAGGGPAKLRHQPVHQILPGDAYDLGPRRGHDVHVAEVVGGSDFIQDVSGRVQRRERDRVLRPNRPEWHLGERRGPLGSGRAGIPRLVGC